jgi:CRP/FNR family transcriptional regulator
MYHSRLVPIVVGSSGREPCAHCDVRHRSVCNAVPDADLARLAAVAEAREYERGQVFITEGERADSFFNVTSGTAKLYKMLPDGRQQITGFAGIGHFLGLAGSDRYAFSAEAIETLRVCRFSRSKLRALLADYPALEQRLLATACNDLSLAQEQMLLLGRKTASERLASFLVAWSGNVACDHTSRQVHLPMTRGEIADHLGLTIETVSRTFTRFRTAGWIRTPTVTAVELLDRPALEDLATGAG